MSGREWTDEEVAFLIECYPDVPMADLMEGLGRSAAQVWRKANLLGLRRDPEFLRQSGQFKKGQRSSPGTEFKKGQASWNKGTNGVMRANRTSFKPGNLPHNTLSEDGAVTWRPSAKLQGYYIRLSLGVWKPLHRHLWEQAHGPLPPGAVLRYRDGNNRNCVLENLELTDRKGNMAANSIHNYPPDVREGIRLIAKLNRKIREHEKQD